MAIAIPLIVLSITALGFAYFIRLAQERKSSRVEEFFVAGRNIGAPLFTQTTWGTSFAFGNSIFYAVWLGYSVGLSALWIQALWAVGMGFYAFILPKLIVFTENYTLHGFLGSLYGGWCRVVASIVSVIGLIICLGFEVSFSAQYFAQVIHLENLEWLVVILCAVFVAAFCSIGGFKANTVTDKFSNSFVFGVLVFLVILILSNNSQLRNSLSIETIKNSLTDFSAANPIYLTGLAFFSMFNIIDMSNWQNVSANSLNADLSPASKEQRQKMKYAMLKASGLFLAAPVVIGTFLGFFIKILGQGTEDQSVFMSKIIFSILPGASIISVIMLGIVTFGFMASSLAGSDSWLLASIQTISWDLLDYKKFKQANFRVSSFSNALHEFITNRARLLLMIIGVIGASAVYYISKNIWHDIFSLQFVIFGGGLSMIPSFIYGVFIGNPKKSKIISAFALMSIIFGYGSALSLFVISLIKSDSHLVEGLPILTLGVSLLFFLIGLLFDYAKNHVLKNNIS